jgi:holliday junction DNA helicase RuvB
MNNVLTPNFQISTFPIFIYTMPYYTKYLDYESRMADSLNTELDTIPENPLRPKNLKDFVGQKNVKGNLAIYIEAAKRRHEPLDHVCLYGPNGVGKSTLAEIIANEMKTNLRISSGEEITSKNELDAVLSSVSEGDVLFIDEIQTLKPHLQKILSAAINNFAIDISESSVENDYHIMLPKFTLVAATSNMEEISDMLMDSFGIIEELEVYSTEDLARLISRSAEILNSTIEPDAAWEIASKCDGTPRNLSRYLKRTRDFADIMNDGVITLDIAKQALSRIKVGTRKANVQ